MRILIRTSKWAIWSRRLGSFALPLVVVPVILHRERFIESTTFHALGAAAVAVAGLAVLFGLVAVIRLWFTGDRGWSRAIAGIILGTVCLAPLAYGAVQAQRYPAILEAVTDLADPPELVIPAAARDLSEDYAGLLAEAFPNVATRTYPVEAAGMFDLVEHLALERGWEVLLRRAPPGAAGEGRLNVLVTTLLGWRDEVALRVAGDPGGARVDMRSVSLVGMHDLGANGRRIEEFLGALDAAVMVALRDSAPPPEDDEADEDLVEPVDTGE